MPLAELADAEQDDLDALQQFVDKADELVFERWLEEAAQEKCGSCQRQVFGSPSLDCEIPWAHDEEG